MVLAPLAARGAERPYHVEHYTAKIEPDLPAKTLTGSVLIELRMLSGGQDTLELDRGALAISGVSLSERPQRYDLTPEHLLVHLEHPASKGARLTLRVDYSGAPRTGLLFFPEQSQFYTVFNTHEWLVSNDIPGDRSTFELHLALPRGYAVVANGQHIGDEARADGKVVTVWRERLALPPYTFGFAVGQFSEAAAGRGRFRFLGAGFSDPELRQIFRNTADMLAFFEERSGVRYADKTYSQALVADTDGQELGGFALMPGDYGRGVLADPADTGLIAHELSHQWWGNRITCRDWTDFWLNEGFATFMAAAYLEKQFGREAYLARVARWKARYDKLRQDGQDHALVYADWNNPSSSDRVVVYQKGAYVLHLLREELGDAAFWKGIRDYSRQYMDHSVVTSDFKKAMERSSRRDLTAFFNSWVYGVGGSSTDPGQFP